MCPEKARVFIIEDAPTFRRNLRMTIELDDHTVVYEAATLKEAEQIIENLGPGQLDAVTLDCELSKHGIEGYLLAEQIRLKDPQLPIIGMATYPAGYASPGLDLTKENFRKLASTLTELPRNDPRRSE